MLHYIVQVIHLLSLLVLHYSLCLCFDYIVRKSEYSITWLMFFQGQSPSIRQLIMHSMAEWYMRGEQYDQAKLSRILDVAQDLKVSHSSLNH